MSTKLLHAAADWRALDPSAREGLCSYFASTVDEYRADVRAGRADAFARSWIRGWSRILRLLQLIRFERPDWLVRRAARAVAKLGRKTLSGLTDNLADEIAEQLRRVKQLVANGSAEALEDAASARRWIAANAVVILLLDGAVRA